MSENTRRGAMTPARRRRVLDQWGHRCGVEGCTVTERLEVDHRIPLALTGLDEDSNLWPLCASHHKAKTRRDKADIARAKRRQAKHLGLTKPKRPIPNRGFDKTLTRTFSGEVRRR